MGGRRCAVIISKNLRKEKPVRADRTSVKALHAILKNAKEREIHVFHDGVFQAPLRKSDDEMYNAELLLRFLVRYRKAISKGLRKPLLLADWENKNASWRQDIAVQLAKAKQGRKNDEFSKKQCPEFGLVTDFGKRRKGGVNIVHLDYPLDAVVEDAVSRIYWELAVVKVGLDFDEGIALMGECISARASSNLILAEALAEELAGLPKDSLAIAIRSPYFAFLPEFIRECDDDLDVEGFTGFDEFSFAELAANSLAYGSFDPVNLEKFALAEMAYLGHLSGSKEHDDEKRRRIARLKTIDDFMDM